MARRRKTSSNGGALGALVLGGLFLIASIPKVIWIVVGALAAIAAIIYLVAKVVYASKSVSSTKPAPSPIPTRTQRPPAAPHKTIAPIDIAPAVSCAPVEVPRAAKPSEAIPPRVVPPSPPPLPTTSAAPTAPISVSRSVEWVEPTAVAKPSEPIPSRAIAASPPPLHTAPTAPAAPISVSRSVEPPEPTAAARPTEPIPSRVVPPSPASVPMPITGSAAPVPAIRIVGRSEQSAIARVADQLSRITKTLQPVEPVAVSQAPAPAPSQFRIPTAPAEFKTTRWVPKGEVVTIAGLTIPGGMLYVGPTLQGLNGYDDPSLINPKLQVAGTGDYTQREAGYWPGYSTSSASGRRAYLKWLAGGRKDPAADESYVFLFFNGIERRAIVDAAKDEAGRAEWPVIAAEVRRLLGIYGEKSESFKRHAGALLDCLSFAEIPAQLYLKSLPELRHSYEMPMYLKVALGQAVADGAPIPAPLALAWVRYDPNSYLRTPATRCAEQFRALYLRKYGEQFGDGMRLTRNRTKLKMVYQPASRALQGQGGIVLTFGDIPDVTALTVPVKKLRELAETVTDELDSFSRYLGKNPGAADSLEGLLLLPMSLWPDSAQKVLQSLATRVTDGVLTMSFQQLLDSFEGKSAQTKEKTLALARALESISIGIEPDVLGGAKLPKPEEHLVLFSLPTSELASRATPAYQAAALTLQLASAVAAADGDFGVEELGHLRAQVQSWSHLAPGHIKRLLAHLKLLTIAPASLTSLKKRLEPLDVAAKETIATFMASVAQADGIVTPAEVKMLEKVYKALGVESKKVFSDVHAAAAGVQKVSSVSAAPGSSGFKLDPARIAALQQDTEAVSAMLSRIFTEELPAQAAVAATETLPEPEREAELPPSGLLGLDEAHSAFARLLLSRPEWSRDDLADAAADLDLMVDGALEQLNDAAFDTHDVPFIEGEDPVTINPELLEKLEA